MIDHHSDDPIGPRLALAETLAAAAAALGAKHFADIDQLDIEQKGHQDLVSNADREVEMMIRDALAERFPDDGIVGEEHADKPGSSGYVWVLDPIDGTANFVRGLPCWATVIACVHDGRTVLGVIHDPNVGESYSAAAGRGAFLNGRRLSVADADGFADGSVGVGFSNRSPGRQAIDAMTDIVDQGGLFFRNASGALALAYVAAGRLIGYCEPHMNAWDCLAALLMIEEAGGRVQPFDFDTVLDDGCRVVAATPNLYQPLCAITDRAFR